MMITVSPPCGDTVIIIQKISNATDKTYKYIFNGTAWSGFEIPPAELAANGTAGLVNGTYGVKNYNTLVNIIGGEIQNIYIKVNGNYLDIRDVVLGNKTDITNIVNGTTVVAEALKATQDALGNNIVNTYMTQVAGATKQYVKDYAMPKEFNNAFVIKKVDNEIIFTEDWSFGFGNSVSLDAVDAPIGETVLGRATYTLGDINFEISSKNSFSGRYQILRSATSTEQVYLKINTYIDTTNGILPLLQSTEIAPINFGNLNISTVNITGKFKGNIMSAPFRLESGDKIYQEYILIREASNSITYSLTSDSIFASNFWLNTGVQTVTYRVSEIGENIYVDLSALTPTVDGNGDVHFATTDSELTRAVSSGTRSDVIFTLPDFTGVSGVTANSKIYVSTNAGLTEFAFASAANNPAKLGDFTSLIRPNGKAILWGTYFPATNVFEVDIPNEKSLEFATGTITLEAAAWTGSTPSSITYYLTGLGDNMVIFAPHADSDRIRADAIGLRLLEAYHATGNVNFYANHAAAMDITLDYIIVKDTGVNKAFLLPNETYATNFSGTAVLEAAEWVGTSYSLTVDGLQNSDMIDLCGESKTDDENYADSGIWVNPSHSGGVVTFVADTAPTVDIYIKYFVTRGR